MIIVEPTIIPY